MSTTREHWTVEQEHVEGSGRIRFGPLDDSFPTQFRVRAESSRDGLRFQIAGRFDGLRLQAETVEITRADGVVVPRDVVRVSLAHAFQQVGRALNHSGQGAYHDRRVGHPLDDDELRLVAAVYLHAYATWGNPRQVVMNTWGLSRTTANRWITKARETYDLPGGPQDEDD